MPSCLTQAAPRELDADTLYSPSDDRADERCNEPLPYGLCGRLGSRSCSAMTAINSAMNGDSVSKAASSFMVGKMLAALRSIGDQAGICCSAEVQTGSKAD